jgi:hypothetical protein
MKSIIKTANLAEDANLKTINIPATQSTWAEHRDDVVGTEFRPSLRRSKWANVESVGRYPVTYHRWNTLRLPHQPGLIRDGRVANVNFSVGRLDDNHKERCRTTSKGRLIGPKSLESRYGQRAGGVCKIMIKLSSSTLR